MFLTDNHLDTQTNWRVLSLQKKNTFWVFKHQLICVIKGTLRMGCRWMEEREELRWCYILWCCHYWYHYLWHFPHTERWSHSNFLVAMTLRHSTRSDKNPWLFNAYSKWRSLSIRFMYVRPSRRFSFCPSVRSYGESWFSRLLWILLTIH